MAKEVVVHPLCTREERLLVEEVCTTLRLRIEVPSSVQELLTANAWCSRLGVTSKVARSRAFQAALSRRDSIGIGFARGVQFPYNEIGYQPFGHTFAVAVYGWDVPFSFWWGCPPKPHEVNVETEPEFVRLCIHKALVDYLRYVECSQLKSEGGRA